MNSLKNGLRRLKWLWCIRKRSLWWPRLPCWHQVVQVFIHFSSWRRPAFIHKVLLLSFTEHWSSQAIPKSVVWLHGWWISWRENALFDLHNWGSLRVDYGSLTGWCWCCLLDKIPWWIICNAFRFFFLIMRYQYHVKDVISFLLILLKC